MPATWRWRRSMGRSRFAVPRASQLQFFGDHDAEQLFEAGLRRLQSIGGRAVEIDYAPFEEAQRMLYEGPFLAERQAALQDIVRGREAALHPVTRSILATAPDWSAVDAYRAIHRLADLKRVARGLLSGIDVMVVPTTPTIYSIAEVEADPIRLNARLGTYTNFVNLMEMCGVAVPAGFRSDGLPLGMTILAEPFREARAAAIAAAAHRASGLPLGATRARAPT